MPLKSLCYLGTILLGCLVGILLPARAQNSPPRPGTPVSATYKGLATTRSYQPLPTTTPGPATAGGPAVITTTYPAVHVAPITDQLRRDYRIDPFYAKTLTIGGIVIIGSDKVSDWAFLEAAYTMDHQLHDSPQWVHDTLTSHKVRQAIMAVVEYTMDLPENRNLGDGAFNDRRSRGLGGMPWCSCAEENLLNLRGDLYGGNGAQGSGENITIHEFAHTLASAIGASQGRSGPFWTALNKAFRDALAPGGRLEFFDRNRPNNPVYAATDAQEYWAEGAQAWFNNANPNNSGGLATRDDVKTQDPALAALLAQIYGDGAWRYLKTTARKPDGTPLRPSQDLDHLLGLDPLRPQFPAFNFNNSPRIIAAAASQPPATRATRPSTASRPTTTATATTTAPQ